jgi:predicted PurR-regulated permease PerM
MITGQVGAFTEELPGLYRNVRNFLLSSEIELLPRLGRLLPPSWDLQRLSQIVLNSLDTGTAQASPLLLVSQVGTVLFYLLSIFGLGYYLTLDRERVVGSLLTRMPAPRRESVRGFVDEVETSVGRFVRGQLLLCGVVGVTSLVAYWLIGLPYALALGAIAAVLEAVPMIGPVLTAIPAAILAAAIGPQQVLYVLIALAVIQILESNVLVPRIMDKAVGVSPLVSILALAFFGLLFGLPGAMLAIPLAAVIQLVLNRTVFREQVPVSEGPLSAPVNLADMEHPSVSGRSRLDRLRLQASELEQDVRKQLRSKPTGSDSDMNDETAELEDLIEITAGALVSLLAEAQQADVQTMRADRQTATAQPAAIPPPGAPVDSAQMVHATANAGASADQTMVADSPAPDVRVVGRGDFGAHELERPANGRRTTLKRPLEGHSTEEDLP